MNFGKISSIKTEQPSTWLDTTFLTFDIDWAHDEVLADTIDLVERAGISASWFVTHETPLLERLRGNALFDIGIHPNFNFLLQGDDRNGRNAEEVVNRLLAFVPEAKPIRSHSLTQNSHLLDLFSRVGLTHDCNHFIPAESGIAIRPWPLWNGLTRVPHFWEDDVACHSRDNRPIQELLMRPGLKVLAFHPIHIFLNTETLARYERMRPRFQEPEELIKHRFQGEGTRSRLQQLLKLARPEAPP